MPYVNVKVAGKLNREQKEKIAQGVTELLEKEASKPPSATYVVIEEIEREDWAVGGKLLSGPAS
jgi:4-oxalocrotonate tautomerase